jgi:hypothetical protein
MNKATGMTEQQLTRSLAYAGFILLAFELVKSLIVGPIKAFYSNTTFGEGLPFKSYEKDVLCRHKNEFEACLLYLRDFMEAIDSEQLLAIQMLRKHRNELAHDLVNRLCHLRPAIYTPLLDQVDRALFKLSNYRVYMEIGFDPEFRNRGIDWDAAAGGEYMMFKEVLKKVRILQEAAD